MDDDFIGTRNLNGDARNLRNDHLMGVTQVHNQVSTLLGHTVTDAVDVQPYDISPVMMNLYGLEQPLYFQLLNRQLQVADRANTRGTVMNLDGTTTQTPSSLQESWSQKHWLLQYDLMFGKGYALSRMGMESLNSTQTDE